MGPADVQRAMTAATAIVVTCGLDADSAVVVANSNKVSLRLLPCDVLARVAPPDDQILQFELDIARTLEELGSPVAALDPRVEPEVYEQLGFLITLWTYYEPVGAAELSPADYADALERLHAGLRHLDRPTPHFTERVLAAQRLVEAPDLTPDLPEADRAFLVRTIETSNQAILDRGAPEQLLHGEPHPGNLLATRSGPRFIDFETCCRGPIEFDLAHAPDRVSDHYPGVDRELLRDCRRLMLAMIIMWRWDREDQLPGGRRLAADWMDQLREEGGHRRSGTRLPPE